MGIVSSNNFSPGLPGQTLTTRILYYIVYSPLPPNKAAATAYEAALLTLVLVLFITIGITFYKEIANYFKRIFYYFFPPKNLDINDKMLLIDEGQGKVVDLHAKR
jgi:hypothetical protein